MQAAGHVQQPCSNPGELPETLRKVPISKYDDLQVFCTLQKPLANYLAALAWRRSRVRVSSGPPQVPHALRVMRSWCESRFGILPMRRSLFRKPMIHVSLPEEPSTDIPAGCVPIPRAFFIMGSADQLEGDPGSPASDEGAQRELQGRVATERQPRPEHGR